MIYNNKAATSVTLSVVTALSTITLLLFTIITLFTVSAADTLSLECETIPGNTISLSGGDYEIVEITTVDGCTVLVEDASLFELNIATPVDNGNNVTIIVQNVIFKDLPVEILDDGFWSGSIVLGGGLLTNFTIIIENIENLNKIMLDSDELEDSSILIRNITSVKSHFQHAIEISSTLDRISNLTLEDLHFDNYSNALHDPFRFRSTQFHGMIPIFFDEVKNVEHFSVSNIFVSNLDCNTDLLLAAPTAITTSAICSLIAVNVAKHAGNFKQFKIESIFINDVTIRNGATASDNVDFHGFKINTKNFVTARIENFEQSNIHISGISIVDEVSNVFNLNGISTSSFPEISAPGLVGNSVFTSSPKIYTAHVANNSISRMFVNYSKTSVAIKAISSFTFDLFHAVLIRNISLSDIEVVAAKSITCYAAVLSGSSRALQNEAIEGQEGLYVSTFTMEDISVSNLKLRLVENGGRTDLPQVTALSLARAFSSASQRFAQVTIVNIRTLHAVMQTIDTSASILGLRISSTMSVPVTSALLPSSFFTAENITVTDCRIEAGQLPDNGANVIASVDVVQSSGIDGFSTVTFRDIITENSQVYARMAGGTSLNTNSPRRNVQISAVKLGRLRNSNSVSFNNIIVRNSSVDCNISLMDTYLITFRATEAMMKNMSSVVYDNIHLVSSSVFLSASPDVVVGCKTVAGGLMAPGIDEPPGPWYNTSLRVTNIVVENVHDDAFRLVFGVYVRSILDLMSLVEIRDVHLHNISLLQETSNDENLEPKVCAFCQESGSVPFNGATRLPSSTSSFLIWHFSVTNVSVDTKTAPQLSMISMEDDVDNFTTFEISGGIMENCSSTATGSSSASGSVISGVMLRGAEIAGKSVPVPSAYFLNNVSSSFLISNITILSTTIIVGGQLSFFFQAVAISSGIRNFRFVKIEHLKIADLKLSISSNSVQNYFAVLELSGRSTAPYSLKMMRANNNNNNNNNNAVILIINPKFQVSNISATNCNCNVSSKDGNLHASGIVMDPFPATSGSISNFHEVIFEDIMLSHFNLFAGLRETSTNTALTLRAVSIGTVSRSEIYREQNFINEHEDDGADDTTDTSSILVRTVSLRDSKVEAILARIILYSCGSPITSYSLVNFRDLAILDATSSSNGRSSIIQLVHISGGTAKISYTSGSNSNEVISHQTKGKIIRFENFTVDNCDSVSDRIGGKIVGIYAVELNNFENVSFSNIKILNSKTRILLASNNMDSYFRGVNCLNLVNIDNISFSNFLLQRLLATTLGETRATAVHFGPDFDPIRGQTNLLPSPSLQNVNAISFENIRLFNIQVQSLVHTSSIAAIYCQKLKQLTSASFPPSSSSLTHRLIVSVKNVTIERMRVQVRQHFLLDQAPILEVFGMYFDRNSDNDDLVEFEFRLSDLHILDTNLDGLERLPAARRDRANTSAILSSVSMASAPHILHLSNSTIENVEMYATVETSISFFYCHQHQNQNGVASLTSSSLSANPDVDGGTVKEMIFMNLSMGDTESKCAFISRNSLNFVRLRNISNNNQKTSSAPPLSSSSIIVIENIILNGNHRMWSYSEYPNQHQHSDSISALSIDATSLLPTTTTTSSSGSSIASDFTITLKDIHWNLIANNNDGSGSGGGDFFFNFNSSSEPHVTLMNLRSVTSLSFSKISIHDCSVTTSGSSSLTWSLDSPKKGSFLLAMLKLGSVVGGGTSVNTAAGGGDGVSMNQNKNYIDFSNNKMDLFNMSMQYSDPRDRLMRTSNISMIFLDPSSMMSSSSAPPNTPLRIRFQDNSILASENSDTHNNIYVPGSTSPATLFAAQQVVGTSSSSSTSSTSSSLLSYDISLVNNALNFPDKTVIFATTTAASSSSSSSYAPDLVNLGVKFTLECNIWLRPIERQFQTEVNALPQNHDHLQLLCTSPTKTFTKSNVSTATKSIQETASSTEELSESQSSSFPTASLQGTKTFSSTLTDPETLSLNITQTETKELTSTPTFIVPPPPYVSPLRPIYNAMTSSSSIAAAASLSSSASFVAVRTRSTLQGLNKMMDGDCGLDEKELGETAPDFSSSPFQLMLPIEYGGYLSGMILTNLILIVGLGTLKYIAFSVVYREPVEDEKNKQKKRSSSNNNNHHNKKDKKKHRRSSREKDDTASKIYEKIVRSKAHEITIVVMNLLLEPTISSAIKLMYLPQVALFPKIIFCVIALALVACTILPLFWYLFSSDRKHEEIYIRPTRQQYENTVKFLEKGPAGRIAQTLFARRGQWMWKVKRIPGSYTDFLISNAENDNNNNNSSSSSSWIPKNDGDYFVKALMLINGEGYDLLRKENNDDFGDDIFSSLAQEEDRIMLSRNNNNNSAAISMTLYFFKSKEHCYAIKDPIQTQELLFLLGLKFIEPFNNDTKRFSIFKNNSYFGIIEVLSILGMALGPLIGIATNSCSTMGWILVITCGLHGLCCVYYQPFTQLFLQIAAPALDFFSVTLLLLQIMNESDVKLGSMIALVFAVFLTMASIAGCIGSLIQVQDRIMLMRKVRRIVTEGDDDSSSSNERPLLSSSSQSPSNRHHNNGNNDDDDHQQLLLSPRNTNNKPRRKRKLKKKIVNANPQNDDDVMNGDYPPMREMSSISNFNNNNNVETASPQNKPFALTSENLKKALGEDGDDDNQKRKSRKNRERPDWL